MDTGAVQWDGSFDSFLVILEWSNLGRDLNIREYEEDETDTTHLVLHCGTGATRIEPGMWIVRAGAGRFRSSITCDPTES